MDNEVKWHVALVRSSCNDTPVPHCTTCGAVTTDLLNSLLQAFDPAVQRVRNDDQAAHSLANTQLLTLSQQLCDVQETNENLCRQLFDLQNHLQEAQWAADHAEM